MLLAVLLLLGTAAPIVAAPVMPFAAPATFQTVPARAGSRDCVRIMTLTIRPNFTYVMRDVAFGMEQYEGAGKWLFDADEQKLVLETEVHGQREYFRVTGPQSLLELDRHGNASHFSCQARLRRAARVIEFSGSMRPVTLWSDAWTLYLITREPLRLPPYAKTPLLIFDRRSKHIGGWTGCSALSGTYAIDTEPVDFRHERADVRFTPIVRHHGACSPQLQRLEATMLGILREATTLHLCCSALTLRGDGKDLAEFHTTR